MQQETLRVQVFLTVCYFATLACIFQTSHLCIRNNSALQDKINRALLSHRKKCIPQLIKLQIQMPELYNEQQGKPFVF